MASNANGAQRVKTSADPQVEAMLSNPADYFARARAAAQREAKIYVRSHERRARPA